MSCAKFIGIALIMAECCNNLGVGKTCTIVAAEIPETKNITYIQLDFLFQRNTPTRQTGVVGKR
ncbi:hypothetical protein N657DRAFT_649878 [Parathielavia appendiculata]|uniref:Secreted protein n=1 Tax=Parathielavia appendiculata TaxID=2587402 RepID=A0AAN6TSM6_9PEZI|nr:hypothetical protein N657DRAFT_649878 [Parathielavia appendiculata]